MHHFSFVGRTILTEKTQNITHRVVGKLLAGIKKFTLTVGQTQSNGWQSAAVLGRSGIHSAVQPPDGEAVPVTAKRGGAEAATLQEFRWLIERAVHSPDESVNPESPEPSADKARNPKGSCPLHVASIRQEGWCKQHGTDGDTFCDSDCSAPIENLMEDDRRKGEENERLRQIIRTQQHAAALTACPNRAIRSIMLPFMLYVLPCALPSCHKYIGNTAP